jgi:hypothetical protein
MAEYKLNKRAGVVVVLISIAAMVLIYYLTVGRKVSRQAAKTTTSEYLDAPLKGDALPGAREPHVQPGPTETPVPKPAGEKKALPPGFEGQPKTSPGGGG